MSCNAMQRCARAYKPCVQLHVEMYGLYDIANLGTDMLTNPTVVKVQTQTRLRPRGVPGEERRAYHQEAGTTRDYHLLFVCS